MTEIKRLQTLYAFVVWLVYFTLTILIVLVDIFGLLIGDPGLSILGAFIISNGTYFVLNKDNNIRNFKFQFILFSLSIFFYLIFWVVKIWFLPDIPVTKSLMIDRGRVILSISLVVYICSSILFIEVLHNKFPELLNKKSDKVILSSEGIKKYNNRVIQIVPIVLISLIIWLKSMQRFPEYLGYDTNYHLDVVKEINGNNFQLVVNNQFSLFFYIILYLEKIAIPGKMFLLGFPIMFLIILYAFYKKQFNLGLMSLYIVIVPIELQKQALSFVFLMFALKINKSSIKSEIKLILLWTTVMFAILSNRLVALNLLFFLGMKIIFELSRYVSKKQFYAFGVVIVITGISIIFHSNFEILLYFANLIGFEFSVRTYNFGPFVLIQSDITLLAIAQFAILIMLFISTPVFNLFLNFVVSDIFSSVRIDEILLFLSSIVTFIVCVIIFPLPLYRQLIWIEMIFVILLIENIEIETLTIFNSKFKVNKYQLSKFSIQLLVNTVLLILYLSTY